MTLGGNSGVWGQRLVTGQDIKHASKGHLEPSVAETWSYSGCGGSTVPELLVSRTRQVNCPGSERLDRDGLTAITGEMFNSRL